MVATIEFLGRDRDKEGVREAGQIRLGKVAAKNYAVPFRRWGARSLLLAIFVLALAAVPALAGPAPGQTALPAAESGQTLAPCLNTAPMGVLGREGGVLSLLGVDGHPEPVSTIVNGEAYAPYAVHNGGSATYVVFVETDC